MAYVIAAAGGHGDYINNEVNAAFLGDKPHWVELLASSSEDVMRNAVAYEDGRRGATHTYRATQHIDRLDRTFLFCTDGPGYTPLPEGGKYQGLPLIMAFNHAAGDWDPPDHWARWPGAPKTVFTDGLCAKHPVTEAIYCKANYDGGALRKFDPNQNSWSLIATGIPQRSFGAIDAKSNTLLAFGDYVGTADPVVLDLNNGRTVDRPFKGLGASALRTRNDAGIVLDEANGTYIVFPTRKADVVLTVRAEDLHIEAVAVQGPVPPARGNGWQNSWQYVPALKGIVSAAAYSEDMLYLRTSA
jgi:hypothetical protein